jgi:predicted PurR-regulated permease PerM
MPLDDQPESKNGRSAEDAAVADTSWQRASQVALIGLFVIALVWVLYAAQHVIVPVLLAWAIATIVLPLVKRMQEYGVPRVVAALVMTFLFLALIAVLILLLSAPLTYWLGRATYIGALLREKLETFTQPLALFEEMRKGLNAIGSGSPALKVEPQSTSLVATILSVVTPAISQFVLFIGALVFYLIYRQKLRNALVFLLRDRDARLTTLKTLNDIDDNMSTYFGTFTLVNLGLGAVTAMITWLCGLPNPLLWGVLAAVLNYIPYIGPAIVIGTLSVVGLLVHPTLGEAALAPLLFVAVVTVEGQFLTPTIMGRRLELNPFAVFLSIAFCTWMWGPLGAFLAVPVLMALSVSLEHAFGDEKPDLPH